jgi:hypothetical protein
MSVNNAPWMVIDDSRVNLHIVASLTDNSRSIFHNHNVFIVQGTTVRQIVFGCIIVKFDYFTVYNFKY